MKRQLHARYNTEFNTLKIRGDGLRYHFVSRSMSIAKCQTNSNYFSHFPIHTELSITQPPLLTLDWAYKSFSKPCNTKPL